MLLLLNAFEAMISWTIDEHTPELPNYQKEWSINPNYPKEQEERSIEVTEKGSIVFQ